jgi:transcriptional regulator with XRE-family HTH domain
MASDPPRIGRKLRRAMERARLDQRQVAAALGVSRSAVNAWINDRTYPQNSIGALEELLPTFRVDDEDASGGLPDGFSPIPPAFRRMVERLVEDPEIRRQVIGLVEGTATWPDEDAGSARESGESPPQAR